MKHYGFYSSHRHVANLLKEALIKQRPPACLRNGKRSLALPRGSHHLDSPHAPPTRTWEGLLQKAPND